MDENPYKSPDTGEINNGSAVALVLFLFSLCLGMVLGVPLFYVLVEIYRYLM